MARMMNPARDWLGLALGTALFLVGALAATPRYWKGKVDWIRSRRAPILWPFGDVLWRGAIRASAIMPALAFVGSLSLLVPAVFLVGPVTSGWTVFLSLVIVLLAAEATLVLAIVLLNRPRFLVPPSWRAERGSDSRVEG